MQQWFEARAHVGAHLSSDRSGGGGRRAPARSRAGVGIASIALMVMVSIALSLPGAARAQEKRASPPPPPSSSPSVGDPRADECFGFSFGQWNPPLDWKAAGQTVAPVLPPEARGTARGDATRDGLQSDSTLMLYPAWWPAGVLVRFTKHSAAGDTLSGTATALVADVARPAPTAQVRMLRVPCRRQPPGGSGDPT
jgi:hypothetical protein